MTLTDALIEKMARAILYRHVQLIGRPLALTVSEARAIARAAYSAEHEEDGK